MWIYNHSDELYHYGIPGMKWGVRKKRDSGGQSRGQRVFDAAKRIGGTFINSNSGGTVSGTPKLPKWATIGQKTDGGHEKSKMEKLLDKGKKSANSKKSRKISSDTALSELEKYKKDQRVKNVVKGTLTGVAIAGLAVVAAPAIYLGNAIVADVVRNAFDRL